MESIARLVAELPKDYEKDCYEQGAITRRCGGIKPLRFDDVGYVSFAKRLFAA